MKDRPVRKNMRLKGYDYSNGGYYFITVCTSGKETMLGQIDNDVGAIINRPPAVILSEYGNIVEAVLSEIPEHYSEVAIDKHVIMPNHIHLILVVNRGRLIIAPTKSVPVIMQQFKQQVTKRIGFSLWQKSYYDHVIRNDDEYKRIWTYIDENPSRWQEDEYYRP